MSMLVFGSSEPISHHVMANDVLGKHLMSPKIREFVGIALSAFVTGRYLEEMSDMLVEVLGFINLLSVGVLAGERLVI
jgi:hypothetical protein